MTDARALILCLFAGTLAALPAAADPVRIISLPANQIAVHPVDGRIYASVPTRAGAPYGDSIAIVDPIAGTIVSSIPVGPEPGRIAFSDTGRYLYIATDGGTTVRRLDLPMQTVDLTFELGWSSPTHAFHVQDMAVMPGQEQTIAISRYHPNLSSHNIAIYDDAVMRPLISGDWPGNSIAWADPPTMLYALNSRNTGFYFSQLNVGPAGLTLANASSGLIRNFSVTMKAAGGSVFSTSGRRVDPFQLHLMGQYPLSGPVEPDAAGGRIFFLTGVSTSPVLRIFDIESYLDIGSINITGTTGILRDLVRWGTDGVAFRTTADLVVLLNHPLIDAAQMGACCLRDGGCDMTTFASCLDVRGKWSGPATDCASESCPQPGACCFPDGGCTLLLQLECGGQWAGPGMPCAGANCAPSADEALVRYVPLAANEIVYSPHDELVYAAVPGNVGPPWGNSLVMLDPVTATIVGSVLVGSEPLRLALSESGRFVYVGLDGAGSVRRYDTVLGELGPPFALGQNLFQGPRFPYDVKVMPESEDIVAVSLRREGVSPAEGGVAIYSGGIRLPSIANTDVRTLIPAAPGMLYGFKGGNPLRRMSVTASGASGVQSFSGLLASFETHARYAENVLYTSSGRKIDLGTMTLAGNFGAPGAIAADPGLRRIYSASSPSGPHRLRGFDMDTLTPEGDVAITSISGAPSDLYRWGIDGLLFRTSAGQIVFVNTGIIPTCYPNCDVSTTWPVLTVDDLTCFINEFAAAQSLPHEQQITHYANCDGSTVAPILTVDDFTCFINAFATGCP